MHRIFLPFLLLTALLAAKAQPQSPPLQTRTDAPTSSLPTAAHRLSELINTGFEESNPMISPDGRYLYFVRRRAPQNIGLEDAGDIWRSKRMANGAWSRPINLGAPLNNRYHNQAVAIDPGGELIYLINSYDNTDTGLACSRRQGRAWTRPEACRIQNYYTRGDGATFHVCANSRALVMGLERPEGQGRRDIYISFRLPDDSWSAPLNLGPTINTRQDESRAFLAADGRTLYFASRGHPGLGGFDLFMSRRQDDSWTNWTQPVNLGEGVNTAEDDEFISLPAEGDPAYLTYRDTSRFRDVYSVSLPLELRPQPVTLVRGKVKSDQIAAPISQASVINLSPDIPLRQAPLNLNQDGSFAVIVPAGEALGLQLRSADHLPQCVRLSEPEITELDHPEHEMQTSFIEFSDEYRRRERDIRDLRLRLDAIDEEIASLNHLRSAYLLEQAQENPPPPVMYDDPAIEALRHQYRYYLYELQDTVPKPGDKDWQKKGSLIPEKDARRGVADDELSEMRKRYRQYYQPEQQPEETEQFLWDDAKSFADFQEGVRQKMRHEMSPAIGARLADQLWPEVRASLQSNTSPTDLAVLDEQELEIREQIAQRLTDATAYQNEAPIQQPSWQLRLETELRESIRDEVEQELEQEMREEIRTALTQEAQYQLRLREQQNLEQEMRQNIDRQIEEEKQQRLPPDVPQQDWQVKGQVDLEPAYQEQEKEIDLIPATPGAVLRLDNVAFSPNASRLKPASFIELDELAAYLAARPNMRVEIAAHTNGWLSHDLSQQLSTDRARVIADYLISKGVAAEQLQAKGYGKTQPIASNESVAGRRQNQRIELRIIEE